MSKNTTVITVQCVQWACLRCGDIGPIYPAYSLSIARGGAAVHENHCAALATGADGANDSGRPATLVGGEGNE